MTPKIDACLSCVFDLTADQLLADAIFKVLRARYIAFVFVVCLIDPTRWCDSSCYALYWLKKLARVIFNPNCNTFLQVFLHICSFLDASTLVHSLSLTCKQLHQILNDDSIWKARISRIWPHVNYPTLPVSG